MRAAWGESDHALLWTMAVAILLHALMLTRVELRLAPDPPQQRITPIKVQYMAPEVPEPEEEQPPPESADALANANRTASGIEKSETPQDATSPLPNTEELAPAPLPPVIAPPTPPTPPAPPQPQETAPKPPPPAPEKKTTPEPKPEAAQPPAPKPKPKPLQRKAEKPPVLEAEKSVAVAPPETVTPPTPQPPKVEEKPEKVQQPPPQQKKMELDFGDVDESEPKPEPKPEPTIRPPLDLSPSIGDLTRFDQQLRRAQRFNALADKNTYIPLNTKRSEFAPYFNAMRRQVKTHWGYPEMARMRGISGQVLIGFSLDASGKLVHIQILQTSGHQMLDDSAVNAVMDASPFQPFPSHWKRDRLNIRTMFRYILHGTPSTQSEIPSTGTGTRRW
ncbi:MAG: energy transducer TonB [Magnetococcales bacterium]|nr:energy transducer TonB [Magnetococcales bacterium]